MKNVFLISCLLIMSAYASADSVSTTGQLIYNNATTNFNLTMQSPGISECWTGQTGACGLVWDGVWMGQAVRTGGSGSTYSTNKLTFNKTNISKSWMQMVNCGPYVQTCNYSWLGLYNPQTNAFEGQIVFSGPQYPSPTGFMRVFWNGQHQ